MKRSLLPIWDGVSKPIIGMLHVPALPGAPGYAGDPAAVLNRVLADAETLAAGGVDGLMLENFGDAPFYPTRVPAGVVAHLTRIAVEVRRHCALPLGINVLRNDGLAALAIAHAVQAEYIRVNVLCGARVTDQGIIEGIAHELLRERRRLGADAIRIFADVNVKHSAPVGPPRSIREEVADLVERARADAVIVTGGGTGQQAGAGDVAQVHDASGTIPVILGSGVRVDNVAALLPHADGIIAGTSLKVDGIVTNPVDAQRVAALVKAVRDSVAS